MLHRGIRKPGRLEGENESPLGEFRMYPGAVFFCLLVSLQFFIVSDALVTWLRMAWPLAAAIGVLLSGISLFASLRMQHAVLRGAEQPG